MRRHLLHTGEKPLPLLRHIRGREHILFRRNAQQPLNRDLPFGQRPIRLAKPLLDRILPNPPPAAQNLMTIPALVEALQRRDDRVPVLPVLDARADEHLLVVPDHALRVHPPVIKRLNRRGVDAQRQLERREREPVFEASDQVRLHAQAVHLPAPQREGRERDDGQDDQPRAVLFAHARHLRGPVEDRDEVWVEAVGAVGVSALGEGEARAACGCAEALGAEEVSLRAGYGGGLGGVVPEQAEEGVWFRHLRGGCAGRGCGCWRASLWF